MKKILALILALTLIFALTMPAAAAFADGIGATATDTIVQTFREQIVKAAKELITAAVIAFFGWLGVQAKSLYNKYVTTKIKQDICRTTVRYVEQVYKDVHGREKMRKAMEKATVLLADYGIHISETELSALLEAAVNEFNGNFIKTEDCKKTADELNRMLM